LDILKHLLSSSEVKLVEREWKKNEERIENIPQLEDRILDMLIERAESIAGAESEEKIRELAREVANAQEEEKIDEAVVSLVAQAERRKMALRVMEEARAEKERR